MKTVRSCYRSVIGIAVLAVSGYAQGEADIALGVAEFEGNLNSYIERRAEIKAGMPKLGDSATPEEIDRHRTELLKAVSKDRQAAKQGDILTPAAVDSLRYLILKEYKEDELTALRKTIFEAENKNVKLVVNAVYPPSEEKLEMPPRLLETLPKLPDVLRYRFVGDALLIVDKENELILDIARNILP